ncbi:MAG: hypothetical protein U1E78_11365 [Gammaproteobacteria bacterium]
MLGKRSPENVDQNPKQLKIQKIDEETKVKVGRDNPSLSSKLTGLLDKGLSFMGIYTDLTAKLYDAISKNDIISVKSILQKNNRPCLGNLKASTDQNVFVFASTVSKEILSEVLIAYSDEMSFSEKRYTQAFTMLTQAGLDSKKYTDLYLALINNIDACINLADAFVKLTQANLDWQDHQPLYEALIQKGFNACLVDSFIKLTRANLGWTNNQPIYDTLIKRNYSRPVKNKF